MIILSGNHVSIMTYLLMAKISSAKLVPLLGCGILLVMVTFRENCNKLPKIPQAERIHDPRISGMTAEKIPKIPKPKMLKQWFFST